jgi:mannose-6-phosphate isomerase-like protein (cupin superfamily)
MVRTHGCCCRRAVAAVHISSLPTARHPLRWVHGTVDEIWYFLSRRGQMWPASADSNGDVVDIMPRDCLTGPVDTRFQFRAHGSAALTAMAITMPLWPRETETSVVAGRWESTAG